MINEAISYAKAGIRVFPCDPISKAPLTRGGFRDATRDPQGVDFFWTKWPEASIGLPTGSITVLDLDAKHSTPDMVERFETVCRQAGIDWLDTLPKQTTPNGNGAHLLFRSSAEIRNRKLATNDKRETIIETRGEGGYILVAPSRGYKWIRGNLLGVPLLHQTQVDALLEVARSFNQGPVKEVGGPPPAAPWTSNTQGLSPGHDYNQRGDVWELLQKHGWHAITKNHWRRPGKDQGISATWDKVPGKFFVFTSNADPFEPESSYSPFALYAILECGGDYQEAARRLRGEGFGGGIQVDPVALKIANAVIATHEAKQETKTGAEKPKPKVVIREHADRLRDCMNPPPWLIHNVIGVGHLACWVALPGVGKTLLAIETASAVAAGDSFAGCEVKEPGRVLYLCTDAPMSTERRMLALPESAQGNVSSVAEFPSLPGGIVELKEILDTNREKPYKLVVLDTWDSTRDHAGGSWADQDGSIEMVMRGLRSLARQHQLAVLIIHHATREGSRTRGSGVFDARMDVIGLVEQTEGIVSLSLLKARDSEARSVGKWSIEAVDIFEDGATIPRLVWEQSTECSMPENDLKVLKAVQGGADSLSSIVQKTKLAKTTAKRVLDKIRQEGLVEMEGYALTPKGREVEEIRIKIMVEQVIRNGGF